MLKASLFSKKPEILSIVLLLLLALISISWFNNSLLIMWDKAFPIDPTRALNDNVHIWTTFGTTGNINSKAITLTSENFAFSSLQRVGLSLVHIQMTFYYILFACSGISMYYLSRQFTSGRAKSLACLLSAVFYMFNPFAAVFVWGTNIFAPFDLIMYSFFPLIFGLFVKGIKERRGLTFIILLALVWTIVLTPAFVNPVNLILTTIPLILFSMAYIVVGVKTNMVQERILNVLKFSVFLIIVWLSLNLFWLFPVLGNWQAELAQIFPVGGTAIESFSGSSASLINTMRAMPFWFIVADYGGNVLVPSTQFYSSLLFLGISVFSLVAISLLLLIKHDKRGALFFGIFYLLGVTFAAAENSPFKNVVVQILQSSNLLTGFRLPSLKFGYYIALSYSYLLGSAMAILFFVIVRQLWNNKPSIKPNGKKIIHWILPKRIIGVILAIGLVISCIVFAFPALSGEIIYAGAGIVPSSRVRIPSYYYDSQAWISSQRSDFSVLSLPLTKQFVTYSWDGGTHGMIGQNPEAWLYPQRVISLENGGLTPLITKMINNNGSLGLRNQLLNLMNIKYVLVHNDTNWAFMEGNQMWTPTSSVALQSFLKSNSGLREVKNFGSLSFYENMYWHPMGIYTASKSVLVNGGQYGLMSYLQRENINTSETVLLLSDQLNNPQALPVNVDLIYNPSISYEKISPTKYVVQVNASAPFYLVFAETYDKGWTASTNGQQITEQYHFEANGFANGWYINKTGSYTITLEFEPQKLVSLGLAVSIIALIVSMIYIVIHRRSRAWMASLS